MNRRFFTWSYIISTEGCVLRDCCVFEYKIDAQNVCLSPPALCFEYKTPVLGAI